MSDPTGTVPPMSASATVAASSLVEAIKQVRPGMSVSLVLLEALTHAMDQIEGVAVLRWKRLWLDYVHANAVWFLHNDIAGVGILIKNLKDADPPPARKKLPCCGASWFQAGMLYVIEAALSGLDDDARRDVFPRLLGIWRAEYNKHQDEGALTNRLNELLKFVGTSLHRYAPMDCEPPGACLKHGRCWKHSEWAQEPEEAPPANEQLGLGLTSALPSPVVVSDNPFADPPILPGPFEYLPDPLVEGTYTLSLDDGLTEEDWKRTYQHIATHWPRIAIVGSFFVMAQVSWQNKEMRWVCDNGITTTYEKIRQTWQHSDLPVNLGVAYARTPELAIKVSFRGLHLGNLKSGFVVKTWRNTQGKGDAEELTRYSVVTKDRQLKVVPKNIYNRTCSKLSDRLRAGSEVHP